MGELLKSVEKLQTVVGEIKTALAERGAEVDGKKLKDYPNLIRSIGGSKPLTAIKIKEYSGKTLDWIADGDTPHRLELESITPEDATIELRNVLQSRVNWESSNPNVVKIVKSVSNEGESVYDAVVVKSGQCTITATLLGIQDSFNVSMEYQSDFHILKKLLQTDVEAAKARFPVGTKIPDTWTDPEVGTVYQMPFIVAHYGDCELLDGTTKKGAYLIRENVLPFSLQFDAKESNNPDSYRRDYGNSRYIHSNIHQWLNAKKPKGAWFQKQHQWDTPPDYANSRSGYMSGCTPALLDAISEVNVSHHAASADGGVIDKVRGNFFLPSLENLNFVVGGGSDKPNKGAEGEVWEYYKAIGYPTDGNSSMRIFKTPSGSISYLWLRSVCRSYSYNVHLVYSGGSRTCSYAYISYAVAPACFIC